MFSENLATFLLQLCHNKRISYETGAEMCNISPRQFGSIVRNQCTTSIATLEKLCIAFNKTPNEILGYPSPEEISFRIKKPVTEAYCVRLPKHLALYAVCPQCKGLIERIDQRYCSHCGQALSWDQFDQAKITEFKQAPAEDDRATE